MICNALFDGHRIVRGHVHGAIVLNVDLDAGLFDDAADHLAARSDDVADLIHRNLHGVRCGERTATSRRAASPITLSMHLENVQTAPARLFQRFLHQRRGDVRHLDIHLERRDAVFRSGNLEIHVAVMIFGARDVGQDGVLVAFLHQTHRHTGDRGL